MIGKKTRITSFIGILIGIIIIIVGFILQGTSFYSIGKSIEFGADFYTEMYDVTKDAGNAIGHAINDLICAIGWLIVSIGAIDVCFFGYKLVKSIEASNNENNVERILAEIKVLTMPIKREAEEKARREAEEKVKREAEEKAGREVKTKKEKTLPEKLAYALLFETDEGMLNYLKNINDDSVQNILKSPVPLVRNQIRELLEQLQ